MDAENNESTEGEDVIGTGRGDKTGLRLAKIDR